ncbi:c-type cytochrome [candidate division KSB1 bacterium]|nr:c-type cytochrome [candidate division KSB1 bacterium]
MRNTLIKLALATLTLGMMACEQKAQVAEDPVARGKYLVTIAGCHDCHTPKIMGPGGLPEPNMALQLSGHPQNQPYPQWTPADMQQRNAIALTDPMLSSWAGPWGVSFAANLTPDVETGIGEWTEENFIQAMRTGKHQGQPNGRDILPPMPWPGIKQMTDADLKAVWAYLRSVPPVKNQVPLPVPPSAPPQGE